MELTAFSLNGDDVLGLLRLRQGRRVLVFEWKPWTLVWPKVVVGRWRSLRAWLWKKSGRWQEGDGWIRSEGFEVDRIGWTNSLVNWASGGRSVGHFVGCSLEPVVLASLVRASTVALWWSTVALSGIGWNFRGTLRRGLCSAEIGMAVVFVISDGHSGAEIGVGFVNKTEMVALGGDPDGIV